MSENPELPALPPGYEIQQLLAHGGMSAVYLARQISLDRLVAIKLMQGELPAGIEQEAQVLAQMNHNHVIGVYDTGEWEGGYFIAMEFAPGGNVAELIEQGPMDEITAGAYIQQVLSGLGAAHRRGLLHLDIKPANLLLDEDGQVKLVDFGLGATTESGYGTPGYGADEIYQGETPDARTDLYAVGMVLYDLLTGTLPDPYTGERPEAPANLRVRDSVWRVYARATTADREERFANVEEFSESLDKALSVTGRFNLPDPSIGPSLPTRRRKRRGGVLTFLTVVLFLLLTCLILAVYFGRGQDNRVHLGNLPGPVQQLLDSTNALLLGLEGKSVDPAPADESSADDPSTSGPAPEDDPVMPALPDQPAEAGGRTSAPPTS